MEQQEDKNKETIVFDIEIFDNSVPFIKNLDDTYSFIDTGTSHNILNKEYEKYIVKNIESSATTTSTANGVIDVSFCISKLPFMSKYCTEMLISDDITVFNDFLKDYGIKCSMIIGTEFFNSVDAVLDFENKKLTIKL